MAYVENMLNNVGDKNKEKKRNIKIKKRSVRASN